MCGGGGVRRVEIATFSPRYGNLVNLYYAIKIKMGRYRQEREKWALMKRARSSGDSRISQTIYISIKAQLLIRKETDFSTNICYMGNI